MQAGKPFLKGKTPLSQGDVTGIVGITGDMHGSLAVSFSEAAIVQVVSNMFGKACKEMHDEVRDAVGASTNVVCGKARRVLAEQGHQFRGAIPHVHFEVRKDGKRLDPAQFLAAGSTPKLAATVAANHS